MTMGPLVSGHIGLDKPKTVVTPAVYTGPAKPIAERERFNRKVKVTFTFAVELESNDFFEEGTPEGATDQMILDKMVANANHEALNEAGPTVLDVFANYQNAGCFDSQESYTGSIVVATPPLFDMGEFRRQTQLSSAYAADQGVH